MKSFALQVLIALLVCDEAVGWISPTPGGAKPFETKAILTAATRSNTCRRARATSVALQWLPKEKSQTALSEGSKEVFSLIGVKSRQPSGLAMPIFVATVLATASPLSASALSPLSIKHQPMERKESQATIHSKDQLLGSLMQSHTSPLDHSVQSWLASNPQSVPAAVDRGVFSSSIVSSASQEASEQQEYSMLDEVWALIDKYYIDRSFHGQDWKAVKETFQSKLAQTANPSDKEPALVSEMVQSLQDKYSRVLDAAAYSAIQKYDLIGVGVTLMPDPTTQLIVVGAPPIPGSASALAGLKQGDWVTAVNGVATKNRNAFDIINQIAESPNAPTVEMTIVPGNHMSEPFVDKVSAAKSNGDVESINQFQRTVTMPRAFAQVKNPIVYKISETRPDGTKVGYVRILEFNALIKSKLQDALHDLVDNQGANALVLDIRHNGGGAFQSAVEISSLFLPERVATYVVDQSAALIPFKTSKTEVQVPSHIPVAIWLDGQSASASEVFAGSLHDNCRAVLMGDKSFGKGLIQAVYGLKNGAGLVLTVARYVTPDGIDIQGTGIQPDIAGHVAPPIPGLLSDTSGVDFAEIRQRLDPSMCQVPSAPAQLLSSN